MLLVMRGLLVCTSVWAAGCTTGVRAFPPEVDAEGLIRAEIAAAQPGERLLLTFGADWCSDSRGLAAAYRKSPLRELIARNFRHVFIDVGQRDNNMAIAARYEVPVMAGIPAIAVLDDTGQTLFVSQATDLSSAGSMTQDQIYNYYYEALADIRVRTLK